MVSLGTLSNLFILNKHGGESGIRNHAGIENKGSR